ncbi:MAG: dienelactone hydrolase family protein [Caldilineaceae bacterium]
MTHPQPDGFLALPASGTGPGVLVLHAWWGLNETIKGVCTRLAEAGFVAFAPDLYHGQVAATIAEAEVLGGTVDANYRQAKTEVAAAAQFLHEQAAPSERRLAVIGFSLGAFFALALAAEDPERIGSVVLFYGTEGTMGSDFSNSRADYLGHFAANDEYEPQSNVDLLAESLRRAGRPLTFHTYPDTSHWFCEPDVTQAYHPAAASLAWERTLAFLKRSSTL